MSLNRDPSDQLAVNKMDLVRDVMNFMNLPDAKEKKLFVLALRRYEITERELQESFWKAYSDQYVPASGIEFRHLWKYIEVSRYGSQRKPLTYEKMIDECQKRGVSTEHAEMIDEEDSQGRKLWVIK